MTKFLLTWILLAALTPRDLRASEEVLAAAGLAFPSIQQLGSARAIGMGSTYVGLAEGSSAVLWNPAGLGTLRRPEIALHHNSALVGAIQEFAVLGIPLGNGNGLGLSLNYEDNGVFDGRDSNGAVTGNYGASAYGASLGWGFGGPGGLSMGLALKFGRQDLAGSASSAFAGDLGVLWNPNDSISVGAAYTNLGPDVAGRQLAQGLRLGAASYIRKGSDFQWLLALSGETLTYGEQSAHLGLEHTLYQFLSLRAGYAFEIPRPESAGLLGYTFGGGVQFRQLSLDYAFVPLADLGSMQRVSLTYAFGEEGKAAPAPVAPRPTPVAAVPAPTPAAVVAAAVPVQSQVEPVEIALILTDADFKRVTNPPGEAEMLSSAAEARLMKALLESEAVDGGFLRVTGRTMIAKGDDSGEMTEIGSRRAALVRQFLVKSARPVKVVKEVTTGARMGELNGIFQVVVR